MVADDFEAAERPRLRSREAIQIELDEVEVRLERVGQELDAFGEKIGDLSDPEREAVVEFGERLWETDVEDRKIEETFSGGLVPLVIELRGVVGGAKGLVGRQEALRQEYLPYKKEDLKALLMNLGARVDYDAVFSYYRRPEGEYGSGSDLLSNTVTELYFLRAYQYEFLVSGDSHDYHYYDTAIDGLSRFAEGWSRKGFLLDHPREGFKIDERFGPEVASGRRELIENLGEVLEQLDRYNRLSWIYRPTLTFSSLFDSGLDAVFRSLASDGRGLYWREGFEEIDFDPEFLAAARRHIDQVITEHRETGHISPTAETLKARRRWIDGMEGVNQPTETKIEGFESPERATAFVTPDGLLTEIQKILPPEIVGGLRVLSCREKPAELPEDDPTVETMGRCLPVFDDKRQFSGVEVEIYWDPFVAKEVDEDERALARSIFMEAVWHEFGEAACTLMTYDEMLEWEQVMAEDKTAVTWYVKNCRQKDEARGKRDDFAESFMLFLTKPVLLHVLSPSRFSFMFHYFDCHLRTDQKEEFQKIFQANWILQVMIWMDKDLSLEDVRRVYLSHESEEE